MNDKKVWFGADSIGLAGQKDANPCPEIDVFRDLSTSLALNDLQPTGNRR